MPRPANAVLFIGQQFVHYFFVGAGRAVAKKSFLLPNSWRDSNQIEVDAA